MCGFFNNPDPFLSSIRSISAQRSSFLFSIHSLSTVFTYYNLRQIEIQTNNILKWFFNHFCLWSFFSLPISIRLTVATMQRISFSYQMIWKIWRISHEQWVAKSSKNSTYIKWFSMIFALFFIYQWQSLNGNLYSNQERISFFYKGSTYSELFWWTFDMVRRSIMNYEL